jgi:hypothetical protein
LAYQVILPGTNIPFTAPGLLSHQTTTTTETVLPDFQGLSLPERRD